MEEVRGVVPNLTRLIFSSIRTGATWATEVFVSYCEAVVRAAVRTTIAVIIAIALIQASTRFDINWLLLLGVAIGGGSLFMFAVVWAPMRMSARAFSGFSEIAREEIEQLSNIFFLFIVTLFYLGIDQGQRHPTLLKIFLGVMALLFVSAILPGKGKLMTFFRERFQLLVLVPAVMMTILAAVPEAITARIINSHGLEEATGTVATEIPFRIDEQDQIIDLTTNQPMELFARISSKGEPPKARKGWTRDKKGNYHLWTWFDGQANFTPMGQEITPVTTAKAEDIIIETKRAGEQKLVDDKKTVDDQKATADAEVAKLKAEAEQKLKVQQDTQRVADETARRQRQERENLAQERAESERVARETAQEEQRQLASRPISVASTILESTDKSQDIVLVRPSEQFVYRGQAIRPDQSVVVLGITDVSETSDKNKYAVTLQPQTLMSGGQRYDISRQTGSLQVIVQKDNSRSILKILAGAGIGAGIGAITGGKKGAAEGAAIGAVAGTVYAVASHGKKFNLTVGDTVPSIIIRPVP